MIGSALLFAPGPGLLVLLAGLGILATEFAWASRAIKQTK
ncbi:MAG: putative transrane protein, partial [Pseudomonadota bacterium]